MRILCIIPPYIPSYFNAGHHLGIFQVAAYLRKRYAYEVDCIDAAALNYSWRDICSVLMRGYDVIAVMNDFDGTDTFARFMQYTSELCPAARTVTFGRLSKALPGYFKRYAFDGIVESGDIEIGVASFIEHSREKNCPVPGVQIRWNSKYRSAATPGVYLDPADWELPDVGEIPYEAYLRMYGNDLNKFCGIPERLELVVPVARGCPIGCCYCEVPAQQGVKDRRLPVSRTVSYIEQSFARRPFEYVSFYAPTFTLVKTWVYELSERLIGLEKLYPWKCTTTLRCLDDKLLSLMSRSGCIRISVGLETLCSSAQELLPGCKKDAESEFRGIAARCQELGIELNCFLMYGINGETAIDAARTAEIVLQSGARARPQIYTAYETMREDMSPEDIGRYNRQIFLPSTKPGDAAQYYELLYSNSNDRATSVAHVIPTWAARSQSQSFDENSSFAIRRDLAPTEMARNRGVNSVPPLINCSSNEMGHDITTYWFGRFLEYVDTDVARHYPKANNTLERVANFLGVPREKVLLCAGSDDAIRMILTLVVAPSGRMIFQAPHYDAYAIYSQILHVKTAPVVHTATEPLSFVEDLKRTINDFQNASVALANPNGFSGYLYPLDAIDEIASLCRAKQHLLLVDEAYTAYSPVDHLGLQGQHKNIILIRSFSKTLGIAGLRLAAVVAEAEIVAYLCRWRPDYPISGIALAFMTFLLDHVNEIAEARKELIRSRDSAISELRASCPNWHIFDSQANFILIDVGEKDASIAARDFMASRGIRIRSLSAIKHYESCIRLTVYERATMRKLLKSLVECSRMSTASGALL